MNKILRLYLPFSKAGIKIELAYKAQIVMWAIISFVEVFFVVFLYEAVYRNAPEGMDAVINGFTFYDMVLYMITSFVFSFVMGAGDTSYNIFTDIREGTIANTLTKPVSYRLKHLFTYLGVLALDMVVILLPLLTIVYIVFIALGIVQFSWIFVLNVVFFLLFTILAGLINDAISYFVGMLVFYTDHLFGLNMARSVLTSFLGGRMVPLAYMGALGVAFSYTPFAFLNSVPVLTIMGKIPVMEVLVYLGVALAWVAGIECVNHFLFRRAIRKISAQGG
jgi:ABC-2 type transport system permease protein